MIDRFKPWKSWRDGTWWVYDTKSSKLFKRSSQAEAIKGAAKKNRLESKK